jgi:hypothetical protein
MDFYKKSPFFLIALVKKHIKLKIIIKKFY